MINLPMQHHKKEHLLRINKVDQDGWKLEFGPWYENGKPYIEGNNFLTKDSIIMDRKDLGTLAKEISKILDNQIVEETELGLTFRENQPQFGISMRLVNKDHPFFSESLNGMVEFTPAINIKYLKRGYGREEDQYLYEDGGHHEGMVEYYKPEEMRWFIGAIEKEKLDNN